MVRDLDFHLHLSSRMVEMTVGSWLLSLFEVAVVVEVEQSSGGSVAEIRGVNRVESIGFGSIGSGQFGSKLKNSIPEPDPILTQ
nr:hypothetical protein [Tanacetum cinerariifolium]